VVIAGADPLALWLWQALLFVSILFHHSNTRLPIGLERIMVRLVVTPRMHGIHHSNRKHETDANYSSLLSIWDRLHRTLVLGVAQREITIGVPAYRAAADVTLAKVLLLPVHAQRHDWHDEDGTPGARAHRGRDSVELQA
jgi:sterol desaturase/sphingolipid hydroxylase (fatty acid hydroxylase superfamily)